MHLVDVFAAPVTHSDCCSLVSTSPSRKQSSVGAAPFIRCRLQEGDVEVRVIDLLRLGNIASCLCVRIARAMRARRRRISTANGVGTSWVR